MTQRWTVEDIPDQAGRTALVTGASSGLGLCSAEALASRGARVLLGCRNPAKAAIAVEKVRRVATGPEPEVVALDLADLASVRAAAARVDGTVGRLDVLMDNAGVMAIPFGRTADGFEAHIGTNHLGHYALTGLLLRALHRAPEPRVVITSSVAHTWARPRWDDLNWNHRRYLKWLAYADSKLANLLFMTELGQRSRSAGSPLLAAAAHPGFARTRLIYAGPRARGSRLMTGLWGVLSLGCQSAGMGALPQLYAATMPGVVEGDYLGPALEFWGYPKRAGSTALARDPDAARRLWDLSEELTGVVYDWSGG